MEARPRISGCLIVKDEEAFIAECLSRFWQAVDEVVVVDTGSTDRTVEIAERLGARVFHHPWHDDFSEARNFAIDQATHPWIFVIDADEYLDVTSIECLAGLGNGESDGYLIDVVNFPDDDNARVITKHLAIFKKDPRYRYEGAIHENIANSIVRSGGKTGYLPVRVDHFGYTMEVRTTKNKRERNRSIILRELRRKPNDVLLNYYLAQELYVHGELEDAVKYYRKALWRMAPRGGRVIPGASVRLMLALWRLSRWDEAYEVLERYQAEYLDYTDLHFVDGMLSRRLGDYQRAEGALLRALSLGDAPSAKYEHVHAGFGTYRAWTELGELYQELGRDVQAFSAFTEALEARPGYAPAVGRLARLALRHDAASDVFQYLSRVAELDNEACANEAWEAFYAAGAWDECEALALRFPKDERQFKDALLAIRRGRLDGASNMLRRLAKNEKFRQVSAVTGVLLAAELNDTDLCRTFLDALPMDSNPELYSTLADLVSVVSASDMNGRTAMLTAVPVRAKLGHAWNLVARSVRLGFVTTLEKIGVLLAWYGENPGQRALGFGKVLQRQGFFEAAAEQYLRAGLDGVYDADSLLGMVRYGLEAGHAEDLVALLEKAIDLTPKRPLPYLLLARTHRQLGDAGRAEEVMSRGRRENPYASLLLEQPDSAQSAGESISGHAR